MEPRVRTWNCYTSLLPRAEQRLKLRVKVVARKMEKGIAKNAVR
jgi:hypothetical protein